MITEVASTGAQIATIFGVHAAAVDAAIGVALVATLAAGLFVKRPVVINQVLDARWAGDRIAFWREGLMAVGASALIGHRRGS
jgi:hypothetical protein